MQKEGIDVSKNFLREGKPNKDPPIKIKRVPYRKKKVVKCPSPLGEKGPP